MSLGSPTRRVGSPGFVLTDESNRRTPDDPSHEEGESSSSSLSSSSSRSEQLSSAREGSAHHVIWMVSVLLLLLHTLNCHDYGGSRGFAGSLIGSGATSSSALDFGLGSLDHHNGTPHANLTGGGGRPFASTRSACGYDYKSIPHFAGSTNFAGAIYIGSSLNI